MDVLGFYRVFTGFLPGFYETRYRNQSKPSNHPIVVLFFFGIFVFRLEKRRKDPKKENSTSTVRSENKKASRRPCWGDLLKGVGVGGRQVFFFKFLYFGSF